MPGHRSHLQRLRGSAQSGDTVTSDITVTLGAEFSKKDGVKGSGSVAKSETRVKDSGTAIDYIAAFGKGTSEKCEGWVYNNAGGKAFARHDSRAGARAEVWTRSESIYLVVEVPDCGGGKMGWYHLGGGDSTRMEEDKTNLIEPFFKAHGYDAYP